MTKTNLKNGVQLNVSGSHKDIKVTPKYPLETVRKLDNKEHERGTHNPPHAHIKLPKFLQKIIGG